MIPVNNVLIKESCIELNKKELYVKVLYSKALFRFSEGEKANALITLVPSSHVFVSDWTPCKPYVLFKFISEFFYD